MVFPKFHIDELKRQEGRDLTRFDLDFDLPDHFLPEFPPPIFLTSRLDLGDVAKAQLVTLDNFYDLFNGILNPKQIEGLRLLLTPFPQQFNTTEDRRSERPHRGVACFDCHVNGHTNGGFHLVGDVRPQPHRLTATDGPIETFPLRGIKESPPHLHDGRLLTLGDTIEFFNLILGLKLTEAEKKDLLAFLKVL